MRKIFLTLTYMVGLFLTQQLSAFADGSVTYKLTIKDGVFTPPSIIVPTHKRIRIEVKNIGTSPAEFENLSLIVEKTLGADVGSVAVIPPLRPGQYKFIDEFHPNMAGFLITAKDQ